MGKLSRRASRAARHHRPPSLALIERAVNAVRPVLDSFDKDCCLNASRILLEVLVGFGIKGRAVSVDTLAGNAGWIADIERLGRIPKAEELSPGSYCLGTTRDNPEIRVGHVVVLAGGWLVDMAAAQFSRPERGIVFDRPVTIEATPERLASGRLVGRHGDSLVVYQLRLDDREFESYPGFQLTETNTTAIAAVLANLDRS